MRAKFSSVIVMSLLLVFMSSCKNRLAASEVNEDKTIESSLKFRLSRVDPNINLIIISKLTSKQLGKITLGEFLDSFDLILYFFGEPGLESWKDKEIQVKVSNDEPKHLSKLGDIYFTTVSDDSDKFSNSIYTLNSRIYLPTISKSGEDYQISTELIDGETLGKTGSITDDYIQLVKEISNSKIHLDKHKGKRSFRISGNSYHAGDLGFIVREGSKLDNILKIVEFEKNKPKEPTEMNIFLKKMTEKHLEK